MDTYCNCLAFRQAARRVTQLYDQMLAPAGLRATQYSLLCCVQALGPIALNPLAKTMVMDRTTLGHNLRPLEARGLIRLDVGEDRRSRNVSITKEGSKLVNEGAKLWRAAQTSFEKKVGAAKASELRKALRRVAASEFA